MTDLEFVNALRELEIQSLIGRHRALFAGKDLLEIGSGAGAQLRVLKTVCKSAVGIESGFRDDRLTDILDYDGQHIKFPDSSFDVIYSSHVLEHIPNQKQIHSEMRRVLRPGGICVHAVPSGAWRIWASILHYPAMSWKAIRRLRRGSPVPAAAETVTAHGVPRSRYYYALRPRAHGDLCAWLPEHYAFSKRAWTKRLESHGWRVLSAEPVGLFMSGLYLFNERLSWPMRRMLARIAGSSGLLFITESTQSRKI